MANPNQDARSRGTGRYVRTPETAARDAEAARLRGEGLTLREIAEHLGYGHISSVDEAITRAYRDLAKPARTARDRRIEQLDLLWEAAQAVLEAHHVVVSNGRVVELEGHPLTDHGPVLQAVAEMRRINESMRKLLGEDAAQKVDLSGGVKYEIVGVDPKDLA